MLLYLITIILSILLIGLANMLRLGAPSLVLLGECLLRVSGGAAAILAIDGLSALIIRRLTPAAWYKPETRLFAVSKREYRFYARTLRIKAWHDKVPELGGFTGFHKDKLSSTGDREYLARFLLEANYGVVIHLFNAVLGVLILFLPFCSHPAMWVPIFIVNFILSLLPVAILRYTSYTLQKLYKRSEDRSRPAGDTRHAAK